MKTIKNGFSTRNTIHLSGILFIITSLSSINTYALEIFDTRADKWEFFLAPQFTNSKLLQFDNGAEADINERSSLGFGLGYNVNRHIELSVMFAASNSNYTGTRIIDNNPEDLPDNPNGPQKFSANLYTSSINFDFTFNLLTTPFTPYVSANIGSTYIDSGVPTGNLTTGCWYDPWWGYVCAPTVQTYTSTRINYGAGAGLRYDFNRKLFIKGGIAINYLDIGSSNTPDFTSYRFTFGFMF
ncbi:MAG: outer membrane protein [Gammaproteobacteria bacterium]